MENVQSGTNYEQIIKEHLASSLTVRYHAKEVPRAYTVETSIPLRLHACTLYARTPVTYGH